jgi:hypothetical protein
MGYNLGDVFTNSSGHPPCRQLSGWPDVLAKQAPKMFFENIFKGFIFLKYTQW